MSINREPLTVNELKKKRDKAIVAYTKFSVAISNPNYQSDLFCFFEGNDNSYYVPRIKQYCSCSTREIYPIDCGGRDKVLKAHGLIINKTEYNDYKKLFFVDRDFNNDSFESDLIYQTPCYSIENLYVNETSFQGILIHELRIEKGSIEFDNIILLFKNRLSEFNSAVLFFNAWYACLIDIRNKSKQKTGVQLTEKFPKGFITKSLDGVTVNYDFDKIKQTFPQAIEISEGDVEQKIAEFEQENLEEILRGKYQLEFFIDFVQAIIEDSKLAIRKHSTNKIKYPFDSTLNQQKALNIFSDYAKTPSCLIDFLQKHF